MRAAGIEASVSGAWSRLRDPAWHLTGWRSTISTWARGAASRYTPAMECKLVVPACVWGAVLAPASLCAQVQPNWTALRDTPAQSRGQAAMAYDAARGNVLLFGGRSDGFGTSLLGDTWTFDGVRWQRHLVNTAPAPRYDAATTYDSLRQEVLLFGGTDDTRVFADLWAWNGSRWRQLQTGAASPGPRVRAGLAFDPTTQAAVLAGGLGDLPFMNPLGDTWILRGTLWQRLPAALPAGGVALAYFGRRSRVVALTSAGGGYELGVAGAWQRYPVLDRQPAWPLVADTQRGLLVVPAARPEVFDGSGWRVESPEFARPYGAENFTYDHGRAALVAFGAWKNRGEFAERFTWEYRVPPAPGLGAAFRPYGTLCASASSLGRVLMGRAGTAPRLGSTAVLEVVTDRFGTPSSTVALGLAPTTSTSPVLAPGCLVQAAPALVAAAVDRGSHFELPLLLPGVASLIGAEVYAQDFGPTCPWACYASNGLVLQLGR